MEILMENILVLVIVGLLIVGFIINQKSNKVKYRGKDVDHFTVSGVNMQCTHCNHSVFSIGKSQLNTAVSTFFNMDWANKEVTFLCCERCGYMHWFNKSPQEVEEWLDK